MKLLVKFSVIFTLIFGIGLAAVAYFTYNLLQANAREQALRQAKLMMEAMQSVRHYTTHQLNPYLKSLQEHTRNFLPQTVPAFAATENFNLLREKYPDYDYKEATLNPTNLRDRAVDWEADIIYAFRKNQDLKELSGVRDAATGKSLYFAHPLRAEKACLECHSVPSAAPASMLKHYGSNNGFGWKEGDVIAAQVVSVPLSVAMQSAEAEFRIMMGYLLAVFVVALFVLNLVVYFTIARPVGRLSNMADQISLGNLDIEELPVRGGDEISRLAESFNRMRRSLVAAMRMIDGQ